MSSNPGGASPPARAAGSAAFRGESGEIDPSDATFEEVLARLQSVVDKLEGGELALEDALAVFEEGVALSRAGAQKLDEAERRIEVLLGGDGPSETRPLDLDGASSPGPRGASRTPPEGGPA